MKKINVFITLPVIQREDAFVLFFPPFLRRKEKGSEVFLLPPLEKTGENAKRKRMSVTLLKPISNPEAESQLYPLLVVTSVLNLI